MGWSGGSRLMNEVISAVHKNVPSNTARERIYDDLIEAFVQEDCDTLDECLGDDIAYDKAYRKRYPKRGGAEPAEEMKIEVKETKTVEAKTLKISGKVSDMCSAFLHDDAGAVIGGQGDGYVPSFMPGGGGDYIQLTIDLETGQVTNWKKPTAVQLQAFLEEASDD